MKTIVSEKGQITIPKPLRIRLGLEPGQVLDMPAEDPVASVYGILRLGCGTDGVMRKLRGGTGLP